MNSCSVRLTFANDDFYETFIEPRKINGDLPTLILRLLTAYAFNDNLAVEIDEYLDSQEDESSGVVQTRQAILNAIAHMNSINSVLESSDRALSGLDDTPAPQETGTSGDINDIPMFTPDDKPVQVNQAASVPASDYSEVMKAIGALTGQVSSLTTSVSALVSGIKTGTIQPDMPVSSADLELPLSGTTEPVVNADTGSVEPLIAAPDATTGSAEVATGSADVTTGSAEVTTSSADVATGSVEVATGSAEVADSVSEQAKTPSELAGAVTERANNVPEPNKTQETGIAVASDEDEDDIFVPDFMSGMIESVNS